MSHGKLKSDIFQDIDRTLKEKLKKGSSKYQDKLNGIARNYIYSSQTALVYQKECMKFGEYVASHSPEGRYTSLEDAYQYAKEYIKLEDNSKSSYTVKMERSALAKLFGVAGSDLCEVRNRKRADITRSRQGTVISKKSGKEIKNTKTRRGRFSEKNHKDEVAFAKGTGMRRSEMASVRGNQLIKKGNDYYIKMQGNQCKGGREREIPVRGDVERIVELCERAGSGKVFNSVPQHMDVHHYRHEYATEFYKQIARKKEDIPKPDRYCCRCDLKGVWYDKKAMRIVSEALGHSRISVIAGHYLER